MRQTLICFVAIFFISSVSYADESRAAFQNRDTGASGVGVRPEGLTIDMDASAGHYDVKTVGDLSEISRLAISFRMTKQYSYAQWPSAAYASFYQGQDRSHSFQFLIIKDPGIKESEMAVGYRMIEGGKEKAKVYLATVDASSYTDATLEFNKGEIKINYGGQKPIIVKTHFQKVTPYISVSSGMAEFKMHP